MYHWGAIVVPSGYTDPILYAAGGNPYGTSYSTPQAGQGIPKEILQAARYQGGRVARFADVIAVRRDQLVPTQQEAAQGAEAAGAN
jgi:NAD(P)H dehydrogenase (quinone)